MTDAACPSCGATVPPSHKFCGECGHKLAAAPASPANKAVASSHQLQRDEFRDVTVLFADVTGFTAMSERLDPEAVHNIMNDCFDGLGRIIQSNGGHIDKYIGDSIMALFGAPVAHEDDPVRAAETAIEMQKFLTGFAANLGNDAGRAFKMRIGINSGLVLAGSIGTEGRRDYSVMGDAVNTASRLEQSAVPGSILVSADFKRRVEHLFAFGPVTTLNLKGKERTVDAFELTGDVGETASGTARPGRAFSGRNQEIDTIQRALAATSGQPCWIEVKGPLGIGKSRLVEVALSNRLKDNVLWTVSRPATRMRPFALARRILFAIYQRYSGQASLPKTREQFVTALSSAGADIEPFFNALWYLAAPDALELKTPDPDPLTFRRTVDRGLERLLGGIARTNSQMVLVLDAFDLADSESKSFFETVWLTSQRTLPAVITTARPDEAPARQVTKTIVLDRLDQTTARRIVDQLTAMADLSDDLKQQISERADGVPLFIEELVRKVFEDSDAGLTSTAQPSLTLPSSVLGVMIARLDQLDAERRDLLAHCSVQGVEFSNAVANRVWQSRGGKANLLQDCFSDLERRQILQRLDETGERWSFSQVLMQNACYDSMLKRDRRILHKEVAAGLVAVAGSTEGVSADLLASHFELSEQWIEAAKQSLRAGDRAAELYANKDALLRYARSLTSLLEHEAESTDGRMIALAAHRNSGLIYLRVGNYAELESHAAKMQALSAIAPEIAESRRLIALGRLHRGEMESAERILIQARQELLDSSHTQKSDVIAHVTYDLADLFYRRGQNSDALRLVSECRALLPDASTDMLRLDILEGRIAHVEGRFNDAVDLYKRAHNFAAGLGSLSDEALTSNHMGNAARDIGNYDDAERYFSRALEIWSRVGLTESIAGAHNNLANLAISRGDIERAEFHYGAAIEAFESIGNAAGTGLALTNLAILAIETGDASSAITKADAAKGQLARSGNRMLLALAAVVKGEALLDLKRYNEARSEFDWVLAEYNEIKHPLAIAGAHRGIGRIQLAGEHAPQSVTSLETALLLYGRLAREQEAARTELFLSEAYAMSGADLKARHSLSSAQARFKKIGAISDLERADKRARATKPILNQ